MSLRPAEIRVAVMTYRRSAAMALIVGGGRVTAIFSRLEKNANARQVIDNESQLTARPAFPRVEVIWDGTDQRFTRRTRYHTRRHCGQRRQKTSSSPLRTP